MVPAIYLCLAMQAFTKVTVFGTGYSGFGQIRIPSIVRVHQALLAFAEGRAGVSSDQENNKIILRISPDNGRSWGALGILADSGGASFNNPCAVVDQSNGHVLLMFQRYPAGLKEADGKLKPGVAGPDVVTSWLMESADDGKTWSLPLDVTAMVKRPTKATTLASGPGVGIQLTHGKHKGRLLIPFNQGPFYQWQVYTAYSDDHGKTWRYGQDVPGALVTANGKTTSQVNEVQVAERNDGSILMLSRHWAGAACRKASVSRDGGQTWSTVYDVPELTDPSCMGSLLTLNKNLLAYSGPDSPKNRTNGTIWISRDQGKSWNQKRLFEPEDFAYSVLVRLANDEVGCLYETDGYKQIVFVNLGKILDR